MSNTNISDDDLDDGGQNGDAAREIIRIEQFWGRNRLVWPWMDTYLPRNRMWADIIATVIQIGIAFAVSAILFHVIFRIDKALFIFGLACISYVFGSFNIRMARAQQQFIIAKRNGAKNG
ncbi:MULTISPECIES: hypothetical protein [unclassified Mesorhizobium]|uniref:hypothetical protein n=1 Tax=unclassified Mesorhizobium TaxID=325217 RepID=UPI001CC91323|nr:MULTISPECIES: hypothetical protein [unclassified Mesorhizobium]MBZ9684283.1 hypothetical protein [Mesorhizobium sp. CO1-1-2]MBZ9923713.1 hypothetical protein [Mesorhizobium sp. BR1-1-4]